jgi:carboxypeptidase C (cathepsin A)
VTDDHMGEAMTEPCVTIRHAIDLPGGRLDYQARAGTVRVGRDDGSPLADVFYLAYLAESAGTRPVTFAFNGGPGIDAPLQVPNVALDLSAAMRRNPALRVYIMGGVYDLATPFAGAEFDISHLYLSERLRRNVRFSWYESGHMTFVDEKVIPVMSSDLARFYASAPGS